jgi:hypothetical protein
VDNISRLKETALSPPCMVRNLPWSAFFFLFFFNFHTVTNLC